MRRAIPLTLLLLGACQQAPLAPAAAAAEPARDAGLAGSGYAKDAAPPSTGDAGIGTIGSDGRAESAGSTLVGSGYRDGSEARDADSPMMGGGSG